MIKLSQLILENNTWPENIRNDRYTWYHGRTIDSDVFSYDYLGKEDALNQEGPGFYFTSNFENAKRYAVPNGIILKCKVNYKKLIVKNDTSNTIANKKIVIDLINNAPDKEYKLENFDENPKKAMLVAVNAYMHHKNACDVYQLIQNDFYKHNRKEYLQVISKYFDAQLTTLDNTFYKATVYHLIVYNPNLIQPIDKIKI